MRVPKTISVLLLGIALLSFVLLLFAFGSPYQRFMRKNPSYYAELASACDLLLQRCPLDHSDTVALSGADVLLPGIIRDLYAESVVVSKDRVWISVESFPEMQGFAIAWKRDPADANTWRLEAHYDLNVATVYPERTFTKGVAGARVRMEIAYIAVLSMLELASLAAIVHLWWYRRMRWFGKMCWSVLLLLPFLGLLFYALVSLNPEPHGEEPTGGGYA